MSLYTITGLPVHALVVHFAVVLLPIAVAGVIASIYSPRFRQKYMRASMLGTFLGAGSAFVAKESGEALAEHLGTPVTHSNLGSILTGSAALFFLLAFYWYRQQMKRRNHGVDITGNATALLGVLVIGLTALTGHTGAQAVWKGRLPSESTATASASPTPKATVKSNAKSISMATVKKHASASSCYAVINGSVYDLTKWINRHPGGPSVIKALCGKDGSWQFRNQHGNQSRPASALASYKIGTLG